MDGTTVQFSCVIQFSFTGTREVKFFVNETSTKKQNIIQAGFTESDQAEELNATTLRLNLTTTASSQYNNTEVYCIGLNTVGLMEFSAFSEVAVLLVQGMFITIIYSPLVMY